MKTFKKRTPKWDIKCISCWIPAIGKTETKKITLPIIHLSHQNKNYKNKTGRKVVSKLGSNNKGN